MIVFIYNKILVIKNIYLTKCFYNDKITDGAKICIRFLNFAM